MSESAMLVAGPGAGKTTTMIQLGDAMLETGQYVPVLIPLIDWAVRDEHIMESLSSRQGFGLFRNQHFMLLAFHGRLCLLLDGWNELNVTARKRLLSDLDTMRREFPRLRIVLTARPQASYHPVGGEEVRVQALDRAQQLSIARARHGRQGDDFFGESMAHAGGERTHLGSSLL